MRFLFFVIFVIGAVSARSFVVPDPKITSSASATASVTGGEGTVTRDVKQTRDGSSSSASASASATATISQTAVPCTPVVREPCQTVIRQPCATQQASASASAKVDYSGVDFKRMTKEEMEAFQRANPGCQLVIRKVNPSPCVVRTPCATLVKRLAPCSPPPIIYNPCVRVPPPCQTKTIRKRISASACASSRVSKEIQPTVQITKTDTPCAPTTTTIVKKIDPVKISKSASAEAKVEQTIDPVVVC